MADNYYGLSLTTGGTANTSAYYYVSITQGSGTYDGAAVTLYPTGVSATYFNYRSTSIQWQAPPSRVSLGATVVTGGSNIVGVLGASPALNVDITLTCFGGGSVTLPAGQTEVPFNFQVSASQALADEGTDFMAKEAAKPDAAE